MVWKSGEEGNGRVTTRYGIYLQALIENFSICIHFRFISSRPWSYPCPGTVKECIMNWRLICDRSRETKLNNLELSLSHSWSVPDATTWKSPQHVIWWDPEARWKVESGRHRVVEMIVSWHTWFPRWLLRYQTSLVGNQHLHCLSSNRPRLFLISCWCFRY